MKPTKEHFNEAHRLCGVNRLSPTLNEKWLAQALADEPVRVEE